MNRYRRRGGGVTGSLRQGRFRKEPWKGSADLEPTVEVDDGPAGAAWPPCRGDGVQLLGRRQPPSVNLVHQVLRDEVVDIRRRAGNALMSGHARQRELVEARLPAARFAVIRMLRGAARVKVQTASGPPSGLHQMGKSSAPRPGSTVTDALPVVSARAIAVAHVSLASVPASTAGPPASAGLEPASGTTQRWATRSQLGLAAAQSKSARHFERSA